MVVRVVEDLPAADRIVFVVNSDHVLHHKIDAILKSYFKNAEVVVSQGLTQGQACSVQLGLSHLDQNKEVLVAACDNTHLFDQKKFDSYRADSKVDALIWTYRGEPRVLVNPHWYGWVQCDTSGKVVNVSVKKPISSEPLGDDVVSGTFWFRSVKQLNQTINQLVAKDIRINKEFYLDSIPNLMRDAGGFVRVFQVQKYIGWGTPADYEDYHLWSNYVGKGNRARAA